VPTFCRHNRLVENCPICSKREQVVAPRSAARRPSKPAGATRAPRRSASSGMTVRHLARAADDGYEHDLVPGLRSSVDAGRLADELAYSAARLTQLQNDPPGLYREVQTLEDREEAAWLAFLIAYVSPLEQEAPFGNVAAARVPWSSGELPKLDSVELGPRSAHEPRRAGAVFNGYRSWAERSGGQIGALEGGESWTPERRFDRAFERLSMSGFARAPRLEFLVLASNLGLVEMDVWSLGLGGAHAMDPVLLAAKRILGIGDAVLLQRRASELAQGAGVPLAALDLAFRNWSAPSPDERVTAGSTAEADPDEQARIRGALGLLAEDPQDTE
jgi:hypothetical protein